MIIEAATLDRMFHALSDRSRRGMLFTEQVVFLDGYPDDGLRRQGTEIGLDNFGAFLDREASGTH